MSGMYQRVSPQENILQVIVNALSGNYADPRGGTAEPKNVDSTPAPRDLRFGETVAKLYPPVSHPWYSKQEMLGNSITWEEGRRARCGPIPKITTQAKTLSVMLGNMLKERVGSAASALVHTKKKKTVNYQTAQQLRATVAKNRLVLEQVLVWTRKHKPECSTRDR